MRKEYALVVLVELDYLEVELLVNLSLSSVFLNEVLGSGKAFNSVGKCYYTALVLHFDDGSGVDAAYSEHCFENIPGILFELLVTEAEATVVLVDFENLNIDV